MSPTLCSRLWLDLDIVPIVMRPDDELETRGEADEAKLTDATRDILGASFYWVMDLAGSVWERAGTIGHPRSAARSAARTATAAPPATGRPPTRTGRAATKRRAATDTAAADTTNRA